MATTAKQVIDRARRILEDPGPSYRIRQEEMVGYVDEAQREIVKIRPDSVITATTVPISALTEVTSEDDTLEISDTFRHALMDWVCYRAMLKRAPYADASRAQAHLASFNSFMMS